MVQQHLPKDRAATQEQEWGYTLWEFIMGNLWYLLGIFLVLGIFLYARSYSKRRKR